MRKITILLLVLASLAFGSPWVKAAGTRPGKLALIVAIGNYPAASGWEQLSSKNDIRILKNALLKQGFAEGDIAIVQDEAATRQGILEAIRTQLAAKVKPGDIAIFHFSGHGQQAADDNKDEVDGYDEALVPFDSPKHYQSGIYEGKNLIRDEELGAALWEVRAKLGKDGHLLTLIDACHSGTATRGMAKTRGTSERMASPDFVASHPDRFGDQNSLDQNVSGDLAPMVALFSASPNQLSYEHVDDNGEGFGILSFTFSKVFGTAKEGATYRGLFDQIRLQVIPLSPARRRRPRASSTRKCWAGKSLALRRIFCRAIGLMPERCD